VKAPRQVYTSMSNKAETKQSLKLIHFFLHLYHSTHKMAIQRHT